VDHAIQPELHYQGQRDPVPGEFRICRHFYPRVQDELLQSFDFLIFAIRQWCAKNPVSSDAAQL
jgi:hypothetical protein